jgi:pimeloyl-ACP methyl ester carboxylesterase
MRSYRGRGAFTTWSDDILADYVTAGFRDLPGGEVTLACAPQWEASGFAAHGHDPWEALRTATCPIEIVRAETGSTFDMSESATLDQSRIHIVTAPGTTHFLPMERPELLRTTVAAAIETGRGPPG